MKQVNFIDLFSGCGGLSLGAVMAGATAIAAVDFDLDSTETYRRNFPDTVKVFHGDIKKWNMEDVAEEVDLILGGPPCQGFSLAQGKRFADDPRNSLYKEFLKAVQYFKPGWFIMENVQGITSISKGKILEEIISGFEEIGYEVTYKVVNMAEYGVPQLRKRTIFVGNKYAQKFSWMKPKYKDSRKKIDLLNQEIPNFYSVNDAIGDLPLPQGNFFSHRANSQMRGPRNRDAYSEPAFTLRVRGDEFALCEKKATSAFIPGPAPDEPNFYYPTRNPLQHYFRQNPPNWMANNIKFEVRKCEQLSNIQGSRKLTIIEQARLQGFPDWFTFAGNRVSQSRQIGNAVPPIFVQEIIKQIFGQPLKHH